METSIIIRTKNEEKWVGEVLEKIFTQTYRDFEVIIVDSGSTDMTLDIIKKFPVRLFEIKPEDFSYPYALNFGCRQSKAEKHFVFLSAHSLPISKTWLGDGISGFSLEENIMGVYGNVRALPDATIWEKLYFNSFWDNIFNLFKRRTIFKKSKMGVLGFTNAIIRKDLWEMHNLNENYGGGGEDGEWCDYWMKKGFVAMRDRYFSVYHSHGLGLVGLARQWKHWKSTRKPFPFEKQDYRK
jgi:rhamnosyltransferase